MNVLLTRSSKNKIGQKRSGTGDRIKHLREPYDRYTLYSTVKVAKKFPGSTCLAYLKPAATT